MPPSWGPRSPMVTYLHRIGRTGRIETGNSLSLVTSEDLTLLKEIAKTMRDCKEPVPESLDQVIEELENGMITFY